MSLTPEVPLAPNYDNNNEANASKMKAQHTSLQQQHRCSSTEPRRGSTSKGARTRSAGACGGRVHLNSLWSVWYGFFGTFLQAYTAVKCTKRFLRYSVLPWTSSAAVWELHACLLVTGLAVLLLPLFLASAVFKVGNYANDGFKLGRTSTICDKDPPSALLGPRCSLWKHGGPTAAFLHLVIAFSMLVPKLVMEARLVQGGFLPSDTIWRTDLDFMVVHHDRLVVLSFMTATSPGNTTTAVPSTTIESITGTSVFNSTKVPVEHISFNFMKMLKDFFSMESSDNNVDSGFGSSVSVEYLNYALALFVYSVRYPAIFWNTNKCFGAIFSLQLLANGLQSLLAFAGMSVLYKVQIIGAWKALPLLRHYPDGMSPLGGRSPFLLNPHVTLALFALSSLLVLSSSLILYLYGHGRFNSFLNQQKDRKHIFVSPSSHHHSWGYFTHCAALCVLVAVAVAYAPLLYDYTVVYRGSLDGAVLACIVASISHLFLWVLVWLFLTIKHRWTFKLRVTVGRATVRSARSVKLVTDIDLAGCRSEEGVQQPLLIVGNGRTYTVSEHSPKKAIMSVIQKAAMDKKCKTSTNTSSVGGSSVADDDPEEQIYWLRPALVSPQRSPDSGSEDRLCWFSSSSRRKQGGQHKHKVTFNEASSTSNIRNTKGGVAKPSKLRSSGNGGVDEDDGDYATLRELPLIPSMVHPDLEDDTTSEEGGKLLACVRDDNVTYASTSRDLIPPGDYEDPSPLLTPEPLSDREDHQPTTARLTAAVNKTNNNPVTVTVHTQLPMAQTPRCLRRADSGMPPEELTPRSDSISTESSSSPPEPPGSNHSETSSGVHSNASNNSDHIHHQQQLPLPPPPAQLILNHPQLAHQQPILNHQLSQVIASRRTASVADLAGQKEDNQWKSCSLQRNVQPPNFRGQNGIAPGARVDYSAAPSSISRNIEPGYGYSGAKAQNLKNEGSNYGYAPQNIKNESSSYGYNNSVPQNIKNDSSNYNYNNSGPQNLKNDTSTYGYNNSKNENSTYGSNSQIPKTDSSSYIHNNLNSQSPKIDSSGYGWNKSNPQTPKLDQSGYGFTKANAQTQNIDQTGYGYTKSNPQTPKIDASSYNYNQNESSNFPNPQNVKTESFPNPEPESHRRNSSYGYSPVIKPDVTIRHNSIYGGSTQITNSSDTITVRGSIYGYTTAGSVASDTNEVVTYSPSTSQQGLYGYTVKPNNNEVISPLNGIYGFTKAKIAQNDTPEHGIPVILENSESTVVIRRKSVKPLAVVETIPVITEEPFGRSTNMKMTSFTENNDLKNIQASSATLPHYPTQPIQPQNQYPHCSTMPLPHNIPTGAPPPNLGAGTSCNVYPRQHSTIPTHHNGVRLFPPNQNPYTKRINFPNGGVRGSSEGIYGSSSSNGQKTSGDVYHYNS